MLTLPVYLRGNTYYLHTRFLGKQVKKSLYTNDKQTAIIKASSILKAYKMKFDWDKIRTYKIDLKNGVLESDSEEDHKNMVEALALLKSVQSNSSQSTSTQSTPSPKKSGLKLIEVLDKMFLLTKKLRKPATVIAYKFAVNEFSNFSGNPYIDDVLESDITAYQEFLANSNNNDNSSRTIDNKVGVLRTLFNFAIAQKYCFIENPAVNKTLVSKRARAQGGYAFFELPEMIRMFDSEYMRTAKIKDPDYYWCIVIAAFSGCRISEITSLTKDQIQKTEKNNLFIKIRDSKTKAGIREVPISSEILDKDFETFIEGKTKLFKYNERMGKGSGGAVSQKFKRHMAVCGVSRPKLVLHSIRKFLNNNFNEAGIPMEARCQFFGHEIEHVNVLSYSKPFSTDNLAKLIKPTIDSLTIELMLFN